MHDTEPTLPTAGSTTPELASSETHRSDTVIISRRWVIAIGALVVLSVGAAVTFGIFWFAANSDFADAQHELLETQGKLTDAKDELVAQEAHMVEYERDAKYTACVQYQGGFMMGKGIDTSLAVEWSKENCAAESSWNFEIKPAP